MRLEHLHYFVALETYGSINKVSQALHTTPQNVSRILKHIEDEMGTDLFLRTPGGIIFTPHGKNMLTFAKSSQQQLDEIKLSIQLEKEQSNLHGEIILYSINSANETFLNDALLTFQKLYPHIMMNNILVDWLDGYNYVEKNHPALGLLSYFPDNFSSPNLITTKLYQTQTLAVVHKDHPYAHHSSVTIEHIAQKRLAILIRDDLRKTELYHLFKSSIDSGQLKVSATGNLNAYYQLAASGQYICVATREGYGKQPPHQREQLVGIPIEGQDSIASYALVMHKDAPLTLAEQHFIKFIRDYFHLKEQTKLAQHA